MTWRTTLGDSNWFSRNTIQSVVVTAIPSSITDRLLTFLWARQKTTCWRALMQASLISTSITLIYQTTWCSWGTSTLLRTLTLSAMQSSTLTDLEPYIPTKSSRLLILLCWQLLKSFMKPSLRISMRFVRVMLKSHKISCKLSRSLSGLLSLKFLPPLTQRRLSGTKVSILTSCSASPTCSVPASTSWIGQLWSSVTWSLTISSS